MYKEPGSKQGTAKKQIRKNSMMWKKQEQFRQNPRQVHTVEQKEECR